MARNSKMLVGWAAPTIGEQRGTGGNRGEQGDTSHIYLDMYLRRIREVSLNFPQFPKKYFELTKRKLSINDLSLPNGGLFDLNGLWNTAKGHDTHRHGNDADINRTDGGGVLKNCEDDKKLKEAVSKIGAGIPTLLCESGGRKHIDFD